MSLKVRGGKHFALTRSVYIKRYSKPIFLFLKLVSQDMTELFNHPTLGKLLPKSVGNVNQFLGLKYASLKDRFAAPKLYSPSSTSIIDATQHGYIGLIHLGKLPITNENIVPP